MKLFKRHPFIIFILSAILVTSCGEMKEEIVIEKDGSGTYEMSFDVIPMMRGMMQGFAGMMEEGEQEMDSAQIAAKVEEMIWKDFQGDIDSTFEMGERLPPEVKEDPEKMAIVNRLRGFMKGSKDKGYLLSGMKYRFDNGQQLKDFYDLYEKEGSNADPKLRMLTGNSKSDIRVTSNSFYRSYQSTGGDEGIDMEKFNQVFDGVSVTTVFTAPKKIKDIKVSNFEILNRDGKTVTLRYDLIEAMASGEPVEVEITW